jgi:hypothetical protein
MSLNENMPAPVDAVNVLLVSLICVQYVFNLYSSYLRIMSLGFEFQCVVLVYTVLFFRLRKCDQSEMYEEPAISDM